VRIAVVHPQTPFVRGGAETHTESVVGALRGAGHEAEFGVMSLWDTLDDVKAFAGEDVDAAHYYPRDERFLLEFEPRVKHFEVTRER